MSFYAVIYGLAVSIDEKVYYRTEFQKYKESQTIMKVRVDWNMSIGCTRYM